MEEFVTIKIRKEYRDMLKHYSKNHGYKMYSLLEQLIKDKCTKKILYSNRK
jgi:hypothetical protein